MKQLFLSIFLLAAVAIYAQEESQQSLPEQQPISEQMAEELYRNGQYEDVAVVYKQLLSEKGESAQLYYNLGNTYFKMNEIGASILNYERALLFAPSDKDILFNLELARTKTVDQLNLFDSFLLQRWWGDLKNLSDERGWGSVAISCFLLFILLSFLFFFSRRLLVKKMSFYAGCTIFLLTICCNVFAFSQRKKIEFRNNAIIMAATVTAKSSPDKSGTDLFVLHEGTKITVKSSLSGWSEIELPDGNIGWIENNKMEKI